MVPESQWGDGVSGEPLLFLLTSASLDSWASLLSDCSALKLSFLDLLLWLGDTGDSVRNVQLMMLHIYESGGEGGIERHNAQMTTKDRRTS